MVLIILDLSCRNNAIGTLSLRLEFILKWLYIYLINDFKDIHRYTLARVTSIRIRDQRAR